MSISDFRARDVAAGGEGAPLSPIADTVLFGRSEGDEPRRRRAILNLGGIANLTVLDDDPARVFGFDTGPANAPLDRLARRLSGGALGLRSRRTIRPVRTGQRAAARRAAGARPFPGAPPAEIDGLRDVRRRVRRPGRRASRRLRRRPDGHAHRVRRADRRARHSPVRRSSARPSRRSSRPVAAWRTRC